jgi:hypothetical protein
MAAHLRLIVGDPAWDGAMTARNGQGTPPNAVELVKSGRQALSIVEPDRETMRMSVEETTKAGGLALPDDVPG